MNSFQNNVAVVVVFATMHIVQQFSWPVIRSQCSNFDLPTMHSGWSALNAS